MGIIDASQDAFGRALLDHQQGRDGPLLMLESDEGSLRPADLQPEEFLNRPGFAGDSEPWKRRIHGPGEALVVQAVPA
jgi:hypothetical protein